MELNKILLTEEEFNAVYDKWLDSDNYSTARYEMAKAQCLKLLKVLEEPCNYPLHIAYVGKHNSKWSCPLCMQELKKDLGVE